MTPKRSAYAVAQARVHGLWPVAIQPRIALVCRFNGLHPLIHANT